MNQGSPAGNQKYPEKGAPGAKKKYYQPRMRFQGRHPELMGWIYDLTNERNPQRYIKTTNELVSLVGRTYKKNADAFTAGIEALNLEMPNPPEGPEDQNDTVQLELWKLAIRTHENKVQEYRDFLGTLYHIVLGQCTDALQNRLKSHPGFAAARGNGIQLLNIIKVITYSFEEGQDLADALSEVKSKFYRYEQPANMSLLKYHEVFTGQVAVMNEVGINIVDTALAMAYATAEGRAEPNDADIQAAKDKAIAIQFIRGANQAKYGAYITELRNQKLQGNDMYPDDLQEAYYILERWQGASQAEQKGRDGVAFAQTGNQGADEPQPGRKGPICYRCNQPGHYANNCPSRDDDTGGNQG